MASLQFASQDRVLVFAPHPDDETIATGELIQAARAAGAAVRIVVATDGENNPWPQRWLERRWRVGPGERARWGQRRRHEARHALAELGIDDGQCVRFLGWPDQGLTGLLMRDDRALGTLVDELLAFAPSHVAMPTRADRHPDHGALRVMLDLALLRAGRECVCLGYTVHGSPAASPVRALASEAGRQGRKQRAMQAHQSQMALSSGRLLRIAARTEVFETASGPRWQVDDTAAPRIRIGHRPAWWLRRTSELLLLLSTREGTRRYRCVLPRLPLRGIATVLSSADGTALQAVWEGGALVVTLPADSAPLMAIHAKLDRVGPRLIIFDREPWRDAAELLPARSATASRHAAVEPG